jgi:hypothetical protein
VTSTWVFWAIVISLSAFTWFLPTVIALMRDVHGLHMVIMVNVLSLVMPLPGWFAAMLAAFIMPKRLPPRPVYRTVDPARMPADASAFRRQLPEGTN